MKRLNIYGAFVSLAGPGTKEDIIIQVAKQQNIRFNDLPLLQKEVDRALEESQRLGFVDRDGPMYKLKMMMPTQSSQKISKHKKSTANEEVTVEQTPSLKDNKSHGQGDGKRSRPVIRACKQPYSRTSSCSVCCGLEKRNSLERCMDSQFCNPNVLRRDNSICSLCGLNSDKLINEDEEETGEEKINSK